ncbi:MAG: glycosyltransferase [Candidatus Kryptonium sp.]
MNICFVLSQREVTGAEAYAVSIADELIKRGHKVFIISDTFTLTLKTQAHYIPLDLNNRNYPNRLRHIFFLTKLIKNEKIDLLHAHSRASGRVSFFASKICGIPLVTTVHGRQHLHISRKIIKAFGDYIIAVCENIKEHLINDLNVKPECIEVLRNGVNMDEIKLYQENIKEENLVTIAGRLSGLKGEIIYYLIKNYILKIPDIKITLVGHAKDRERFASIDPRIKYIGFSEDLVEIISKSSVLIASGRIAIKGLCLGVPTIAIGGMFPWVNHGRKH